MQDDMRNMLVLIAVVILASGCQTGGSTDNTGTSVVSVNTFEAIPSPVPAGQTVTLNMELENTGDSTARRTAARVFGPAWLNSRYSKASRTKSFGELRAESDSSPAIPKTKTWSFETPSLRENREATYTIFSKIFYRYTTTATSEFKLVSGSRFREQGYSQTDATVENSQGPIQLDIRGTTPKIYYSEEGSRVSSEICVVATNEGKGTAFTGGEVPGRMYELGNADKDNIRLTISARGNVLFQKADGSSRTSGELTVPMRLINGEKGYQCFTMTVGQLTNSETNVNVNLEARYNYKKEASTTVTVEGRRGTGSQSDIENNGNPPSTPTEDERNPPSTPETQDRNPPGTPETEDIPQPPQE